MKRYRDPLFAPERRHHPALIFFAFLLVFLVAAVLVFNQVNNSRVTLLKESVTVPALPASLEDFRILHISDLHGLFFGERQEHLAAAFSSARFQAVCVTGDVTGPEGDARAFLTLIDLFTARNIPVYFISGDEDPAPLLTTPHQGESALAPYILEAQARGAIYLDAPVNISPTKDHLWLCPEWVYSLDVNASITALEERSKQLLSQEPSPQQQAALQSVAYQLEQMERIREVRRQTLERDTHIALTHHPLQLSALANLQEWTASDNDSYVRTVSLVLAGHYVGGQWRIPGIGALRAPLSSGLGNNGWFPDDEKVTGLSSFLSIPQYISPGLGVSSAVGLPGFRLFNTPAVTLITLTSKLIH